MMRKLITTLSTGLLAALLPACDAVNLQELKPGISTAREVRERMGQPTSEWRETDGSVVWEYPRTPNGIVNYMVVIGPDEVLREIRQVLTEENFARVRPGMSQEEIRRLLGKPANIMTFPLKQETVWDWKIRAESGGDVFFNVHFDPSGRVVRTSTNQNGSGG
jgi:outer membrane protein assembly factor BamE (lipoprotein component of BamABCDE complex)